jgi:hypothetical protein
VTVAATVAVSPAASPRVAPVHATVAPCSEQPSEFCATAVALSPAGNVHVTLASDTASLPLAFVIVAVSSAAPAPATNDAGVIARATPRSAAGSTVNEAVAASFDALRSLAAESCAVSAKVPV